MARRSLKPQLNQIRAWVRQGRTDAWIAHQLEVSTSELREFRKQHGFTPDEEDAAAGEIDLRDEIEAEIEAASAAEEPVEDEEEPEGGEKPEGEEDDGEQEKPRRKRRRGRRGGRGRRKEIQATFDHGETDGYGLWLDPAARMNPTTAAVTAIDRADMRRTSASLSKRMDEPTPIPAGWVQRTCGSDADETYFASADSGSPISAASAAGSGLT